MLLSSLRSETVLGYSVSACVGKIIGAWDAYFQNDRNSLSDTAATAESTTPDHDAKDCPVIKPIRFESHELKQAEDAREAQVAAEIERVKREKEEAQQKAVEDVMKQLEDIKGTVKQTNERAEKAEMALLAA